MKQQLSIHLGHCYTNGGIAYGIVLFQHDDDDDDTIWYQQSILNYLQFQNSGILLHSSSLQPKNKKNIRMVSIPNIPTNNVNTILRVVVKPSLHPSLFFFTPFLIVQTIWYSFISSLYLNTSPPKNIYREKKS